MNLVPWRANPPLTTFQREVNRLFEDFLGSRTEPVFGSDGGMWPNVNVSEDDKNVLVTAELPGVDKNDIHVDVHRDILTLSGEKREDKREDKHNIHRIECSYGRFHRQIRLPMEVESENTEAHMKDGVLSLRLPKAQASQRRQIDIT